MPKPINPSDVQVQVTDSEGKQTLEGWNKGGRQSDGSIWTMPEPLVKEGHEHFFKFDAKRRWVQCECGFGGFLFPHNAVWKGDGHIYNKKGEKVI